MKKSIGALSTIGAMLLAACAPPGPDAAPTTEDETPAEAPRVEWAIALHGGAGVIPKTMEEDQKQAYFDGLTAALTLGRDLLAAGESSLDVVEKVIRVLEDDPLFNAGKGAVFTHEGRNELDAAIMDGRDLSCGAISGVSTVKNPISLARLVMTDSRHVFFVGPGAEQFADEAGVERVDPGYFFVQRRWDQLQEALAEERGAEGGDSAGSGRPLPLRERDGVRASETDELGTVGVAVLDRHGDLAAGTSTGGMTNKRFGRVGDVPVIGAGTYANNKTAAISCTGFGEQFIRNNVSHDVSALIEYKGMTLQEAAEAVIHGKLNPGDGGLIAVDHSGAIALVFNSEGMFRGAADAGGRFEVAIWE